MFEAGIGRMRNNASRFIDPRALTHICFSAAVAMLAIIGTVLLVTQTPAFEISPQAGIVSKIVIEHDPDIREMLQSSD